MLRSRAAGDDELFYSIALQQAAYEARQGRKAVADEIRSAVEVARAEAGHGNLGGQTVAVSFNKPRGDLASLLELRTPSISLRDVVLSSAIRDRLDEVVRQQSKRTWLREHGRVPHRTLLFVGPPGAGKTMTAEALAKALRLPLHVIRLDAVITRYMGETATKLRLVFDEIHRRRAVYLFDEFDAIGADRGASNDVAEMRRVLNSFLQFLEEPSETDSVVIGATNYPKLLDRALLRRFDFVIAFEPPTKDDVRAVVLNHIVPMKPSRVAWTKVAAAAAGLSQAEIARAANDAVKTAILDQRRSIRTDDLISQLETRQSMRDVLIQSRR